MLSAFALSLHSRAVLKIKTSLYLIPLKPLYFLRLHHQIHIIWERREIPSQLCWEDAQWNEDLLKREESSFPTASRGLTKWTALVQAEYFLGSEWWSVLQYVREGVWNNSSFPFTSWQVEPKSQNPVSGYSEGSPSLPLQNSSLPLDGGPLFFTGWDLTRGMQLWGVDIGSFDRTSPDCLNEWVPFRVEPGKTLSITFKSFQSASWKHDGPNWVLV